MSRYTWQEMYSKSMHHRLTLSVRMPPLCHHCCHCHQRNPTKHSIPLDVPCRKLEDLQTPSSTKIIRERIALSDCKSMCRSAYLVWQQRARKIRYSAQVHRRRKCGTARLQELEVDLSNQSDHSLRAIRILNPIVSTAAMSLFGTLRPPGT